MPIIFLKNPRTGSHFRFIGGTKGGRYTGRRRAPERDRIKGIRSVGWASCNTAFQNFIRWGKPDRRERGPIQGRSSIVAPQYALFLYALNPKAWERFGFAPKNISVPGQRLGPAFNEFKKPCR
jgi:hypothetical protein